MPCSALPELSELHLAFYVLLSLDRSSGRPRSEGITAPDLGIGVAMGLESRVVPPTDLDQVDLVLGEILGEALVRYKCLLAFFDARNCRVAGRFTQGDPEASVFVFHGVSLQLLAVESSESFNVLFVVRDLSNP